MPPAAPDRGLQQTTRQRTLVPSSACLVGRSVPRLSPTPASSATDSQSRHRREHHMPAGAACHGTTLPYSRTCSKGRTPRKQQAGSGGRPARSRRAREGHAHLVVVLVDGGVVRRLHLRVRQDGLPGRKVVHHRGKHERLEGRPRHVLLRPAWRGGEGTGGSSHWATRCWPPRPASLQPAAAASEGSTGSGSTAMEGCHGTVAG